MTERTSGFCDYSRVMKEVEKSVVCPPQLLKGYKDKNNCPECPKARYMNLKSNPTPDLAVEPLRQRDIRRHV